MTFPKLLPEWHTVVWRGKYWVFLAGGVPADSAFLEKYLNVAHHIADLLLGQAAQGARYSLQRKAVLKHLLCIPYELP